MKKLIWNFTFLLKRRYVIKSFILIIWFLTTFSTSIFAIYLTIKCISKKIVNNELKPEEIDEKVINELKF